MKKNSIDFIDKCSSSDDCIDNYERELFENAKRAISIEDTRISTDSCIVNASVEEEDRKNHHLAISDSFPDFFDEEKTFTDDDKTLFDFALGHRNVSGAPDVNLSCRKGVFTQALEIARMKTIVTLMGRMETLETTMLSDEVIANAELKELSHAHKQIKEALAMHLDYFSGKNNSDTPPINQINIQNNKTEHTTNIQNVVEDPDKRKRVMSTFKELIKGVEIVG